MFANTIRAVTRQNLRCAIQPIARQQLKINNSSLFKISSIRNYSDHHEETFDEFSTRYEKEFEEAYDLFEVQRVLNNCFSYDLVPSPSVIEKALRACRRVNDYATAVRVFEGLKFKVENKEQYQAYLDELKDVRAELGIDLKEELFTE
ncbi:cytochrome c oxidase subunit VI [Pichia kluyveri]|uniref:Cytochrome c oxidase subunit 6, mitochondrial n=1 Tax=Pichia kluyveri TaxID=36015 RepID=A0AAV5R7C5_PICKL|nr:cytochrome c oxidase subunit VI [Pichia kluyveri]